MDALSKKLGGESQRLKRLYRKKEKKIEIEKEAISELWIESVKGCYVFGKQHLARENHPRAEVLAVVRILRDTNRNYW